MAEIDQVGIQPDSACSPSRSEGDQQAVSGMPVDRASADSIASQLETDSCVLTAEALLESQLMAPSVKAGHPLLDTVAH